MHTPNDAPRQISDRAMQAVMAKDREAWLDCFSADALLRDPVGGSPLDPEATGLRGREGLGRFWDQIVAPLESVAFEVREAYTSGDAIAKVATVRLKLPTGASTSYGGVFVYDVDAQGLIAELRGYFTLPS